MWSSKVLQRPARLYLRELSSRTITSTVKATMNFNSKHLAKGDPLPPYNGTLRIYNMRFCPFAQRTILALNAKAIDYEIINVNLMNKPDWLYDKCPFGKVPVLEIGEGKTIYESLVTVEYLDEVYSNRPLLSKDPVQKACDKMIVEASGALHTLFVKLAKMPDRVNESNIRAFLHSLNFIQTQLMERGTEFLYGNQPGYVDYMIWPWFERLRAYANEDDRAKFVMHDKNYESLWQYVDKMMLDPTVSQYLVPVDVLNQFHKGFQLPSGPDYELLNKSKL